MAQQCTVTINGFVGADPVSFGRDGGPPACSFRVGCTRRHFDASAGVWKDHPTTWITVKAFRALAVNARMSVHKGDPVIVTGVMDTEEWQKDGVNRSRSVIEASGIGHDLGLGISQYRRIRPGVPDAAESSDRVGASSDAVASGLSQGEHTPPEGSGSPSPSGVPAVDGVSQTGRGGHAGESSSPWSSSGTGPSTMPEDQDEFSKPNL